MSPMSPGKYVTYLTCLDPFALRSFSLSSFFCLLFFPCLFFLLRNLLPSWKKSTLALTLSILIFFTLPYRWLGLDRFFFNLNLVRWNDVGITVPNWFSDAWKPIPAFPHEFALFGGAFAVGMGAVWLYYKKEKNFRTGLMGMLVLVAILIQTGLHLSLRSPYTYAPHFELPESSHYWYHFYFFPLGQGAVNADYWVFRNAEELFMGTPKFMVGLMSRSFPYYLSSQFTYFWNPYYVWLILNIAFWGLSVFAIRDYCKNLFGNMSSKYAVALMASAPGLIFYVGQPMSYLMGTTSTICILALQRRLFTIETFKPGNAILFGGLLGLYLLCYNAQPWVVAILIAAALMGYSRKWSYTSVALALVFYFEFLELCSYLPNMEDWPTMAPPPGQFPLQNLQQLLKNRDLVGFLRGIPEVVKGFPNSMFHSFGIAFIPACIALFKTNWINRKKRLLLLTLLFPAFVTFSFMELGKSTYYSHSPRIVYSAYPAVYILCSIALAQLTSVFRPKWAPKAGQILAWSFISCHFILSNLDVFGYPEIYLLWYYRTTGYLVHP